MECINPPSFAVFVPESVDEAVALLSEHSDDSRVLAGGMSLIPMLKLRLTRFPYLVDIGRLKELTTISEEDNRIVIGSMVTDRHIEDSVLIREKLPILSHVSSWIGDNQVRARGTMGGSLCQADPSGDWGACMLALKGHATVRSIRGKRTIDADDLFVDMYQTSLEPDELLVNVSYDIPSVETGYSYKKMERKAGDYAVVAACVSLGFTDDHTCSAAGIGMTAVGVTPVALHEAEEMLVDRKLSSENIEKAASVGASKLEPLDDPLRGSSGYRKRVAEVYLRRAIEEAARNGGGLHD